MFTNLNFEFDGISSQDMNTIIVNTSGGLMESNFGIVQTVIEDKLVGKDVPYFYKIDRQTYTIPITITKVDANGDPLQLDSDSRFELVRWLIKNTYKEFRTDDYPGQVFYMMFTEGKSYITGGQQGYLNLIGRMNAPYCYQEKQIIPKDFSNSVSNIIYLSNLSNVIDNYKPEIQFTLVGTANNITITNLTNNTSLIFTGLNTGETIYINNQTGQIKSSLNIPRLDKCNRGWISLNYGENQIQITTNAGGNKISFMTQFPMAF